MLLKTIIDFMSWKQKFTDSLAEKMRFCVRGALIIQGFILALASTYVVSKLAFFTVRYLDRVWFGKPW